jgi:predicted acyl esterase
VSLDLYAKSNAVDTDFTAKLVDVDPDGFARNLTEGIVRALSRLAGASAVDESWNGISPSNRSLVYQQRVSGWA